MGIKILSKKEKKELNEKIDVDLSQYIMFDKEKVAIDLAQKQYM